MEPERYRPFNRRGRELELAARPLLVLSGCQRAGNHNNKTKTHLHRFLYTTFRTKAPTELRPHRTVTTPYPPRILPVYSI